MDIIKFIIVGATHVGKTSIINQYIENKFSEEYMMTMSQDKSTKEIELGNNTKIKIETGIQLVKKDLEEPIKYL